MPQMTAKPNSFVGDFEELIWTSRGHFVADYVQAILRLHRPRTRFEIGKLGSEGAIFHKSRVHLHQPQVTESLYGNKFLTAIESWRYSINARS